jgi:hypothetical protein
MILRLGLVFVLVAACLLSRGEAKDPARFREVRVQVLGVDGKPAADREVFLMGLSRSGMGNAKDEGWHFKSDADGRFVVRLAEFKSVDERSDLPGWGEYALVSNPTAGDAGALSDFIVHSSESPKEAAKNSRDWGPTRVTGKEALHLTMRVHEGVTLRGRVVDYLNPKQGQADVPLNVCIDLQTDTHTGYGGEIFERVTKTDAEGRFTISQVYPAPITTRLGVDPQGPIGKFVWLKTQRGDGKWVPDADDTIVPKRGVGEYEINIMAANRPLFRYSGKVTDRAGKPVEGATLTFGVSFHRQISTYEDSHHTEKTTSKPDGTYDVLLSTPWISGMVVEQKGFVRKDRWAEGDEAPFAPGVYNLKLQPTP